MSVDQYALCPCGSGKAFKFCCKDKPYYDDMRRADTLFEGGQHAAALDVLHKLTEKYPDNATLWGYKARLLYRAQKPDDADDALQKAFEVQPNFPFGHYLRGLIRHGEGEILGALIEFRKAAELYDPKARDMLGEILHTIASLELRLNRPVAGRAALERAKNLLPGEPEIRQVFDALFGPDSRLPESARKAYSFRPAPAGRQLQWKSALDSAAGGRLTEAFRAFEQLTQEDPNDAAAWFNLGLAAAWLGGNPRAIEALMQAGALDPDESRGEETYALVEVLRCSAGMADQSDYRLHRTALRIADPPAVVHLLQQWEKAHRLAGVRPDEESGTLSALVLEETPNFGTGIGAPVARSQAYMLIVASQMLVWHSSAERVAKVVAELREKLGPAVSEIETQVVPGNFGDAVLEALSFPTQNAAPAAVREKMEQFATRFFEEEWLHRPLIALGGLTPIDAASSAIYRKRLRGLIRFLEECFQGEVPRLKEGDKTRPAAIYDFDRLRRKLGLSEAPPAEEKGQDFAAMSTEELAGLSPDELTDEQLGDVFRAALQLDARDLAGHFARKLIARPANPATADRYAYFSHLIQQAQPEGDTDSILSLLEQGEKSDQELNEGKHASDYALRRGQIHAKRGEADKAREIFEGVIGREPNELRLYGSAAEAMLGQKRGAWALQFAEQGLAKSRSQNNRDSERYFMELVAAAKKLGG